MDVKVTIEEFFPKPGSTYSQVDADELGPYLLEKQIRTKADIARDGQNPESPIYKRMTHDPVQGLWLWNLEEAGRIARGILCRAVDHQGRRFETRVVSSFPQEVIVKIRTEIAPAKEHSTAVATAERDDPDAEEVETEKVHPNARPYVRLTDWTRSPSGRRFKAYEALRKAKYWYDEHRLYRSLGEFQPLLPIFEAIEKAEAEMKLEEERAAKESVSQNGSTPHDLLPLTRSALSAWPRFQNAASEEQENTVARYCGLGSNQLGALRRLRRNLIEAGPPRGWMSTEDGSLRPLLIDALMNGLTLEPDALSLLVRTWAPNEPGLQSTLTTGFKQYRKQEKGAP